VDVFTSSIDAVESCLLGGPSKGFIYIKSISQYKVLLMLMNIMFMPSPPQKILPIYTRLTYLENAFYEHGLSSFWEDVFLVCIPDGDLILCAVTKRKRRYLCRCQLHNYNRMFLPWESKLTPHFTRDISCIV